MVTKSPSHTQLLQQAKPRLDGKVELVIAPLDTLEDSQEERYRKLKQQAYMALIKACIRIMEEERNGG